MSTHLEEFNTLYRESIEQPEKFWENAAQTHLHFFQKWTNIFSFENENARWFDGGLLNVSYNCLDRHIQNGMGNKTALIWEGEDGENRTFTYAELHASVCQFSNALENLGIQTGDFVALYMPMIPEAVIALLAFARVGATHTVVFGGFSSEALADRMNDCGAKILVTADGGLRKGDAVPLKEMADRACAHVQSIEKIIVVNRIKNSKTKTPMQEGRDLFWHDIMQTAQVTHTAKHLPSEHPLFILYTSGTTGKPKGLVHTTAGYLLGATLSAKWIFDLKPNDILWTTADIGWITALTYMVYGPLSNGATVFMYEGVLLHPHPGRIWETIEKHKISILYTAPTAIRMCVKLGREWPDKYNLSSLRLLGTVGEPINPDTWNWYNTVIGHERCPIVDTWWQTETGSAMITGIAGLTKSKPGSATFPFFGIAPVILDENGAELGNNQTGFLCIKKPWPSMARTIRNDHERYRETYWHKMDGVYFTGDGAYRDDDGYYWITGRLDDVLNVSGHRMSAVEIENAIVSYPDVAECAVVGIPDSLKGQVPIAFVVLKHGIEPSSEIKINIQKNVEDGIGKFARTESLYFVQSFPKTRSGKVMRRLLREFASTGSIQSDVSTLDDVFSLATLENTQ